MRIIDSNKDFYDFYQNIYHDSSLVFDRRDSFNLTKEDFMKPIYTRNLHDRHLYLVLQIHHSFWLFDVYITRIDNFEHCKDYELSLMANWKDYNKESKLIELSLINFTWFIKTDIYSKVKAIINKDYHIIHIYNSFTTSKSKGIGWEHETKHIPILQYIGIASHANPLDIYLAFEEYFSAKKTAGERIESVGLTNEEKITNHGFDTKTSFRGKN